MDLGQADNPKHLAMVNPLIGPELSVKFPEVLAATRFLQGSYHFRRVDAPQIQYQENAGLYADASVFQMFSFSLEKGDPSRALVAPFSVVLSEPVATRYFGDSDPIGRVLLRNGHSYTVTGVLSPISAQSHFTFDLLVSLSTGEVLFPDAMRDTGAFIAHTYILTSPDIDLAAFNAKLDRYINERFGPSIQTSSDLMVLRAEPLTDVYLKSKYRSSLSRSGSEGTLFIFALIATFILIIACINFMNLATVRATERFREVGIRKAIGAKRGQLALQFMGESVVLACLSAALALILIEFALPAFRSFADKNLIFNLFDTPVVAAAFIGIALIVGLTAGTYPAFVLSSYRPAAVLGGVLSRAHLGSRLGKGLVVFQFAISIGLMVSTGVVYSQIDYMRLKDLGFQKDQLLIVDFYEDAAVQRDLDVVRTALSKHPSVQFVSASGDIPGTGNLHASVDMEDAEGTWRSFGWRYLSIDHSYPDTYGLDLIAGRSFRLEPETGSNAGILLNETAVTELGFSSPQDALGRNFESGVGQKGSVIGVVRDFHLKSLQQRVEPAYMLIDPDRYRYLSLRLDTVDMKQTVSALERVWKSKVTSRPFDYHFLDDSFGKLYRSEEQFGQVVALFSGLAVVVACLGLYGLASLSVRQRRREIGLRKILGAAERSLLLLVTRDFSALVLIAFAVAAPVSYFAMTWWLNGYPYHAEFDYLLLLKAGVLAFVVALVTVSYQACVAVRANPIETLRYK